MSFSFANKNPLIAILCDLYMNTKFKCEFSVSSSVWSQVGLYSLTLCFCRLAANWSGNGRKAAVCVRIVLVLTNCCFYTLVFRREVWWYSNVHVCTSVRSEFSFSNFISVTYQAETCYVDFLWIIVHVHCIGILTPIAGVLPLSLKIIVIWSLHNFSGKLLP